MDAVDEDPDDWVLIDRIIELRTQGWTFEQIGAHLQAEGFDASNRAAWPVQILRRLVRQRNEPDG